MRLKDKVALITGSSSGIGKGIAIGYAKEGANIIVNYNHRKEAANEVAKIIKNLGRKAIVIKADVSNKDEVDNMVNKGIEEYGKIDILVNNSGITKECLLLNLSEEMWNKIINVNLKGAFLCSQAVAKKMINSNTKGKIINISSNNSFMVEPKRGPYCISKGGMDTLTKSLAAELGSYGINVNGMALGTIKGTNIAGDFFENKEIIAKIVANIPLGRLGTVEDCVGPAIFLASEESSYFQGETIVMDGGLTILEFSD